MKSRLLRAGVLVEAERQLELAAAHAGDVEVLELGVDVAPGIVVSVSSALDLELDGVDDFAGDADPLLAEIDRIDASRRSSVGASESLDVRRERAR